MRNPVSGAIRGLLAASLLLALAACGLPRSGPTRAELFEGSVLEGGNAFVVSVNERVTRATTINPGLGFGAAFRDADVVGSDAISPGDVLSLTIFENVRDDPLLGNTGQRVSVLETVQVDGAGFIFIPYAGRLLAAGQTPESLRQIITAKLENQTPDPQVTVQRVAGDGATVSVSGTVGAQGVYPIERPTRTLSAMLAKAGGVVITPSAAIVRVTRGSHTGRVWLEDLYANPALDIALRAGDRIVVEQDTRAYVALGATGAQSRVPFQTQTVSAVEAIANVGGLNSSLADPTGVFVLRDEPANIANAVLGRNDLTGDQRMIYVLDLTEPAGVFEARDFLVRDGDTLYVTEAPWVQWTKTLAALNGTASGIASLETIAPSP